MYKMQCRYCLETNGTLIRPCACVTPVHPKCLQKWKSIRKLSHCEICLTTWPAKPPVWPIYLCICVIVIYMTELHSIIIQTCVLFFSFGALASIFLGLFMWISQFSPFILLNSSWFIYILSFVYNMVISPLLLVIYTWTSWKAVLLVMNTTECLLIHTNITTCFF